MPEANARAASVAARLAHNLSHRMRIVVAYRLEAGDDAGAVSGVAVLARLPFAADVQDLDLDADDRPALHGDEISGRVADRPGLVAALLKRPGQLLDLLGEPGVVHQLRPALRLDHRVVPGRHDFAGLALGLIPGRGDVMVMALEHDEHVLRGFKIAPLRVRAGQMDLQRAELRGGRIENERNRIGDEPPGAVADQEPEHALLNQRVERRQIFVSMERGFVHLRLQDPMWAVSVEM
jgi:hypothetical protein